MAVKGILSWVNPTTNTDGSAYDGAADNAGYTIEIDGQGEVSVPLAYGTNFDLNQLADYQALKAGSHTVAIAAVTKEGVASDFSAPASFSVAAKVPSSPTGVSVA